MSLLIRQKKERYNAVPLKIIKLLINIVKIKDFSDLYSID